MDEKKAQEFLEEFNAGLHRLGRITLIVSVILLVGAPFIIGAVNGVMPDLKGFLSGFAKVGIIYIPVGIVEFLVYSPMLGAGGSYLAFITGNVTNMKIPCAINARDIAKTKVGTPENEIISTLSVATSAIVTTLVIVVGVVLMIPLRPVLENPVLVPAFDNVVPALFGALGLKYFSKSPQNRGGTRAFHDPVVRAGAVDDFPDQHPDHSLRRSGAGDRLRAVQKRETVKRKGGSHGRLYSAWNFVADCASRGGAAHPYSRAEAYARKKRRR